MCQQMALIAQYAEKHCFGTYKRIVPRHTLCTRVLCIDKVMFECHFANLVLAFDTLVQAEWSMRRCVSLLIHSDFFFN